MDSLWELLGFWLAWILAVYGFVSLILTYFFIYLGMLLAAFCLVAARSGRGGQWLPVPDVMRRRAQLAVEIVLGLVNPVLYLTVLVPALPELRSAAGVWLAPLSAGAWILLIAIWSARIFGAVFDARFPTVRAGIRLLLVAAFLYLLLFLAKDTRMLPIAMPADAPWFSRALMILRLCPLYLIPAVLLLAHIRSASAALWKGKGRPGLFLLPDRAARVAVACTVVLGLVAFALAAHRRSDARIRDLLREHRESICEAAAEYDVDPRLIASIIYVTHRDQLSPFRNVLERILISTWSMNMRREIGSRGPERMEEIGADENPVLHRALDISVGLTQIKPRTAQTASVLATGATPDVLPRPAFYLYRDAEPIGDGWTQPSALRTPAISPIAVPAERHEVASALLSDRTNLRMCALLLFLYRKQWETANEAWSLRGRPDILATLYQIGFARSRPHGAPRSNAFGDRVRQVYEQPWIRELLEGVSR